jgi:malonate transporter
MTDLLLLFVPFFALVLMGWGAARSGLLPLDGIPTMNTFVLFFGLPAMIFRLGASGALHQSGLGGLLLAYGLAGTVVVTLGLAWGIKQGLRRRDSGLAALVTAFPNTGFLGLPLLTGLLGAGAGGSHLDRGRAGAQLGVSGLGAFTSTPTPTPAGRGHRARSER